MKIIKTGQNTTVFFSDGTKAQRTLTDEQFEEMIKGTEEEIKEFMFPNYKEAINEINEYNELNNRLEYSNLLNKKGDSIYWEEVSELSMPKELVKEVLEAESNNDEDKLTAYKNFWVLMSLNPDSRCRQNLFWFLKKYGMTISKYGLFVGYRNADIKIKGQEGEKYSKELIGYVKYQYNKIKNQKKSPKKYMIEFKDGELSINKYEEYMLSQPYCLYNLYTYFNERNWDYDLINPSVDTIYTDHHSHTFTIKIGKKVSMNRFECDSNQDHVCSTGLHVSNLKWLKQNYFGDTGLICLVNPASVIAVPPYDSYGKMRVCEYLPIGTIKYDENGDIIPYNLEDGFKSEYVSEVIYDGDKSGEDEALYTYKCPNIPELNASIVCNNLIEIAKQAIKDRVK